MRRSWLAIAPLLGTLGCTGTVSGSSLDAEAATSTSAIVVVERTSESGQGTRAEGSARFVRVAAPATVDDALRAIGASLELPSRGSCAGVRALAGEAALQDIAPSVELVDVGTVSLETNGVLTRLMPRRLPDVTDVVSGVVYARAADPVLLPAAARYLVRGAGGPGIAPFEASATAPEDPATIHVTGEDDHGALTATGAAVELTWTPDASDDTVYVDVRPNGVRCVLGSTGRFAIATALLDESGTLVVHRLRREALRVPGADSGEIRFDFARSLAYTRK